MNALQRLLDSLASEIPDTYRRLVGWQTPRWILDPDFDSACSRTTIRDALEYARRFQKVVRWMSNIEEPMITGFHADDEDRVYKIQQAVSAARLSFGSMLETYSKLSSLRLADVGHAPISESGQKRFARLCHDAYFAALWTDCHSVYSMEVCGDDSRIAKAFGPYINSGIPTMRSTMSMSAVPSFVQIFMRGTAHGVSAMSDTNKLIFSLLSRCTQCGSRGWENALALALKNESVNLVVTKIFTACVVGMHPQLHPAARLPWDKRHVLSARLALPPSTMAALIESTHGCMKECTRIYCCSMLAELPAVSSAFAALEHPIGVLKSTPLELAATSLQVASILIANAGSKFQNPEFGLEFFGPLLNALVSGEQRTRKRSSPGSAPATMTAITHNRSSKINACTSIIPSGSQSAVVVFEKQEELVYSASWLGKNQRIVATRPPALQIIGEVLARTFRAEFVPVWIHANSNGLRVTRLNVVQQQAIHNGCSTHRITNELDEDVALRVQRLALSPNVSQTINFGTVAKLLNFADDLVTLLSASTNVDDAIGRFVQLPKHDAAKLILFCKVLATKDRLLSFNLGPRTRQLQVNAIRRRFAVPDSISEKEMFESGILPIHAAVLFSCLECGRISNAHVNAATKPVPHNEIGLSQTMLRVGGIGERDEVRCARRSSAALRTTMARMYDVKTDRLELMPLKPDIFARKQSSEDSSHSARLRRDVKSCAEQSCTAIACGDRPMLEVSLLGRVARINGGWYSICAFCGCTLRVKQKHRFGHEFCCLRCDPLSLNREMPTTVVDRRENDEDDESTTCRTMYCRFCGKPSGHTIASRFKVLAAPLDDGGRNAALPPPLRRVRLTCWWWDTVDPRIFQTIDEFRIESFDAQVAYCSSHFRVWLEAAHKSLTTNVIFAHLAAKAVPVFGADGSKKAISDSLRLENKRSRPKESQGSKKLNKILKKHIH